MDTLIKELKSIFQFKDTTAVGDIVLIVAKEPQMLFYAYISNIERDMSRKDEWWHIEMHILSVPPQKMTWTLRTQQMTGMEVFTMGGEERFLRAIDFSIQSTNTHQQTKKSGMKKNIIKRIK